MNPISDIVVAGSSTVDARLNPQSIVFLPGEIDFTAHGIRRIFQYDGPPLAGEGKATARRSLDHFQHVKGASVHAGGGLIHTARELSRAARGSFRIVAVDSTRGHRAVHTELFAHGVGYAPLGADAPQINLELRYRRPDTGRAARAILRSPRNSADASPGEGQSWTGPMDALLINSCKNSGLVRALSDLALERKAPQFSVLTPALSARDRLRQLARNQLSQANWAELQDLARRLGISCTEGDEDTVRLADAAELIQHLAKETPLNDFILTLGPRGALTRSRASREMLHIGLAARHPAKARLDRHPELVNGRGDRFFARAVFSWLTLAAGADRVGRAAKDATLAILNEAGASSASISSSCLEVASIAPRGSSRKAMVSTKRPGGCHGSPRDSSPSLVSPAAEEAR